MNKLYFYPRCLIEVTKGAKNSFEVINTIINSLQADNGALMSLLNLLVALVSAPLPEDSLRGDEVVFIFSISQSQSNILAERDNAPLSSAGHESPS